ncbi:UxaA family hydrolase [Aneurinibacillus tyrosinisolvens]|uniref:UxaA family hydrolase n=1 Tax=Aneurinibacillus tyrosinisolvens TaxID=1443435 RepID=UPI00063F08CB|nr:UxaA family hydrolase [Aneurinibacillus tyrosinisolvens]
METSYKTVVMKPVDHVAVALIDIPAGAKVKVTNGDHTIEIELKDSIRFGHKFAIKPIEEGEDILKYGEVIGMAVRSITVGEHVHVHNLEGKRGRGDKISVK